MPRPGCTTRSWQANHLADGCHAQANPPPTRGMTSFLRRQELSMSSVRDGTRSNKLATSHVLEFSWRGRLALASRGHPGLAELGSSALRRAENKGKMPSPRKSKAKMASPRSTSVPAISRTWDVANKFGRATRLYRHCFVVHLPSTIERFSVDARSTRGDNGAGRNGPVASVAESADAPGLGPGVR